MSLSEYGWTITDKSAEEIWDQGEYKIGYASGTGTFAKDGSQATMVYYCQYGYHPEFLDSVLGKTVKQSTKLLRSAATPTFDATQGALPEQHPFCENFYAASAEVEPLGKPSQQPDGSNITFDKARITVVFRPVDYNVITDDSGGGYAAGEYLRFTSKVTEAAAEFQTSMGSFKFVSSQRVLPITPGQTVPSSRVTYTWMQIPTKARTDGKPNLGRVPNETTITPLVGSINSQTFDGYSPGTLLFVTWMAKLVMPQVASSNNYYWNISYVFGVRDYGTSGTPVVTGENIGWNYSYDPVAGAWDLYTTNGTVGGGTMYSYKDHSTLFSVGW